MSSIYLPLYAPSSRFPNLFVAPRSGLNQAYADGRDRDFREVYIPIPAWIHHKFPGFLPRRSVPFGLHLPNGKVLNVSVCQEGEKALMSNPNSDLGQWIFTQVLLMPNRRLVTYQDLKTVRIDSVKITEKHGEYYIEPSPLLSYEKFKNGRI